VYNTPMKDLFALKNSKYPTKCMGNFFKSTLYKDARDYLYAQGLRQPEILHRVAPAINRPAQANAHIMITLAFIQWADPQEHQRMVHKLLKSSQYGAQS
jgi:hypothetical protein